MKNDNVIGWIGGISRYNECMGHPIVRDNNIEIKGRRQLVKDLEEQVRNRHYYLCWN